MSASETCIPFEIWQAQRLRHIERVRAFTSDRVSRASLSVPHPVYDFLFTYYSFRPSHLERWSPGADVVVADHPSAEIDWRDDAQRVGEGWVIPSSLFPRHRGKFLQWCITYLSNIAERTPSFSCFGLHEWAMVYRTDEVRHSQVPLRVSHEEVASVVESLGLRCSHYDAFRFFTPEAVPLNREGLSRENTPLHDQRACIHVTMDLYKYAYKVAPWCPSELVADAFLLAAAARAIDMRASPYELSSFGFEPICVETPEGRQLYVQEQRNLAEQAVPIRTRLLDLYRRLHAATDESAQRHEGF